ncbi:hypothetical protein [Lentzea sp. NPDC059081]|uniref:hypothetical protein n=1 Tax=Lentzea sp. NPDC059081 TaxID=3346719 RepID=UPI0036CEFFFF
MNRSLRRAVLSCGALTTAALLAFGGVASAVLAQEPDPSEIPTSASPPPETTTTTTTTTTEPPSSSAPQPPSSEQAQPRTVATPAALRTTVEFDKQQYLLHEDMRIKFTITNIGEQAAERVRFPFPIGSPMYDRWNWSPLRPGGDGIQVAPGETRVLEFSGAVADRYNWQDRTAGFTDRYLDFTGRTDNREDHFGALAAVTPTAGDVRGVVYGDSNHNGRQDEGEALAGMNVQIFGAYGNRDTRATGSDGRFLFEKVEGGPWLAAYQHPDGWVVPTGDGSVQNLRVTPDGVELLVRAERPSTDSLTATLTLDKGTYQAGEQATISVALSNNGSRPVTGVQAACRDFGDYYIGTQVNWGDLAPTGEGVTIGAGETRTFSVVDVVPQDAVNHGEVLAVCIFGPQILKDRGFAEAGARAVVPGGFGSIEGLIWHSRDNSGGFEEGEGVAAVRVVLHDKYTDAVVAEAVTDESGRLTFDHVPAGWYVAHVDGPWTYRVEFERVVHVTTYAPVQLRIQVDPKAEEPWPPTPGPTPPGPGGSAPPPVKVALAQTGASVLGLCLLGGLLVAFGTGAVAASRNREA